MNDLKGHPWYQAFLRSSYGDKDESYREGFRSGWLDYGAKFFSRVSVTTTWNHYAVGYVDGYRAAQQKL